MQWSTVSNAFWKSRKISTAQFPLSSAFTKFSNIIISAMNVECLFRNPNRNWLNKSCLLRNFSNRLYMRRSKIFENTDNNEIGRWLLKNFGSLALYIRVTTANFSSSGNTPGSSDKLAILVSGRAIKSDTHLICFGRIPSLPEAPSLSSRIINLISGSLVGSNKRDALMFVDMISRWETLSLFILEARDCPIFAK